MLARARQAEHDLLRLRDGIRRLQPRVDVDALIAGDESNGPITALEDGGSRNASTIKHAASAISKLTDANLLAKLGLEIVSGLGNIVERKTRRELLSSDEIKALRALAKNCGAGVVV